MPAIMRRTPQSEEASRYGYADFLKEVIQKTVADTAAGFKRPRDFSDEEIMQMAFAGVGGGIKKVGEVPLVAKDLMKLFSKEGLKYDAFVNPFPEKPEFSYHQWTLYGEGPAKGATIGTKGTSLEELEKAISKTINAFSQ